MRRRAIGTVPKLTLQTLPMSTNAIYRGRRFLTEKGKSNKVKMAWEAKRQWGQPLLTGLLTVEVSLFWPDKRRHDVDNIKALLDSLSGIIYKDDSQIQHLVVKKAVDKERPRVEIIVAPLLDTYKSIV